MAALNEIPIETMIYLWTRDAKMSIGNETERYIVSHLRAITSTTSYSFSDPMRIAMCQQIVALLNGG